MKEKPSIVNKIFSICFLGLMMIFGIAAIVFVIKYYFSTETYTRSKAENISFLEQYPFSNDVKESSVETSKTSALSKTNSFGFVDDYQSVLHRITDKTEQYLTTYNPLMLPLKKCISTVTAFLNQNIVLTDSNVIVKLSNRYFTEVFEYCPSYESYKSIFEFSTWLNEKNIPFVSLITPDKSDDSVTEFPKGIPHGYALMMDEYKAFMNKNKIRYIDAKELLLEKNGNFYEWFYRTDYHWNVSSGIEIARRIAEYFESKLSVPSDTSILADDNFELVVYPNSFLGNYGRICLDSRCEDMEVLYPTVRTNFHIQIPGYGVDKTGSFENTLINQRNLSNTVSSYSAFLYGDYPLIHIDNFNCQNGTKVLVIKYSLANVFCTYLANTVQHLDMIDPRHFNGSVRTYIERTSPDVVILCMGVASEYYEESLNLK